MILIDTAGLPYETLPLESASPENPYGASERKLIFQDSEHNLFTQIICSLSHFLVKEDVFTPAAAVIEGEGVSIDQYGKINIFQPGGLWWL